MPFRLFHDLFPEVAERETRCLSLLSAQGVLPAGDYAFREMFCDEPGCDCRRALFWVDASFREGPEAVIAWGWEDLAFYERWIRYGDKADARGLIGPILSPLSQQTELAPHLLRLFEELVLTSTTYVERVKRHYAMFRGAIEAEGAETPRPGRRNRPAAKPVAKAATKPTAKAVAKRAGAKAAPPPLLQLRITLMGIDPPIWRRVLVRADFTFEDLHNVIQGAMGWTWSHMHGFRRVGSKGRLGDEIDEDMTLGLILSRPRQRVGYEYDFGDSWLHEVTFEKTVPGETAPHCPYCLEGARACPPEDCGGPAGYYDLLDALRDPTEGNAELREWLGGYDPEAFDAAAVNRRFAGWHKRRRR